MHLAIIGRSGSGKTTLGSQLTEHLNVPHISSGDIARDMGRRDTSTDLALRQGAHAPEEAMRAAIRDRLERADAEHGGWILEGFPRTLPQLVCLMQWSVALPIFLHLEVSEWACIERLTSRAREDDNPDSIARKLESFRTLTQPMVDVLDEGGVLRTIYGDMAPDNVLDFALREIQR